MINATNNDKVTDHDDESKKDFIGPVAATPILLFVLTEVMKAFIGFFTMKALRSWWDRNYGKGSDVNQGVSKEKQEQEAQN